MGHDLCDMRSELFEDYTKETKQMNKKTITTSRRWDAVRMSTGRVLRSFNTREGARMFKRTHRGIQIFDTVRQVAVR